MVDIRLPETFKLERRRSQNSSRFLMTGRTVLLGGHPTVLSIPVEVALLLVRPHILWYLHRLDLYSNGGFPEANRSDLE